MTYVFYDTETTGTATAFDQILQFAAIKTDDDLNEQERFNLRCRLLPHVVPSPGALCITGVTPEMLLDQSLPSHYEAICQLRRKLTEWSPACFVGYNSIQFDEDLLRQAFFQTLHPAYLTNTGGNCRGDVMRLAHAASVYAPDSITVPADAKGKPTFRLEKLALANGHNHDNAHDALADVIATISIARQIRDKAPKVWEAMSLTTKKNAAIKIVRDEQLLAMTERYGPRMYSWAVTFCGSNPNYDGQVAVFDLNSDPDEYRSMSVEQLVNTLKASPKIIRTVRANAQPILMPLAALPDYKSVLKVEPDEAKRRAAIIRADLAFQGRVGEALVARYADEEPSEHVEERIYDGFPTKQDEELMQLFHQAKWDDRLNIASQIEDERLNEFAHRMIYFEREDLLPNATLLRFRAWHADRLLSKDNEVPWMTVAKAVSEADKLLTEGTENKALLENVKAYLNDLAAKLDQLRLPQRPSGLQGIL